ncbi:ImmA/IrrE family metallo-endopeptidase [Fusobacterium necrophorum]|uniref:ImmA/IrrE family metallo-endopeptidase n=1 Tax=Fusobacterium necrophorum TaxID=859 RepID=UPI003A6A1B49
MDIGRKVKNLVKCHGTNDPFKIAKQMGIIIIFKDLGHAKGYYKRVLRKKVIVLNERLDEFSLKLACAHELGHAILHSSRRIQFLLDGNFPRKSIYESQANEFAYLLLREDDMEYFSNGISIDRNFIEEMTIKYGR